MADSDFLYQVGIDTRQAKTDVDSFLKSTATALDSLGAIKFTVDTTSSRANISQFVQAVNTELKTIKGVNVTFNLRGATRSLNSFVAGFQKNAGALGAFQKQLEAVDGTIDKHNAKLAEQSRFFENVANATKSKNGELRSEIGLQTQDARSASQNSSAHERLAGSHRNAATAARGHGDALDRLNSILGNSVYKLVEYEIVMAGFNYVITGVKESLAEAGNVQMEQTLQGLYGLKGGQEGLNESLRNAIIISKQWGANITDVQQVIGLWTKNTGDLAAATYLANQAEMLHRASGIETSEVYRMSIALTTQLGTRLSALPGIYDEVAEAALKLAVPMNNVTGTGKMEAMKEIFEGLAESAATLKSMGFDKEGTIAVVANQVQAVGENGRTAAKNLSMMFAALEGRGTGAKNFQAIMGGAPKGSNEMEKTDDLLQRMQAHAQQLFQAYKNGDLGVKPAQFETLATFESSLKRIAILRADLYKNSNGKLQLISDAEMNIFNGQLARAKSTVQAFSLTLGNALLPGATAFLRTLNGGILPGLQHMVPGLIGTTGAAIKLGAAFLALTALGKLNGVFEGMLSSQRSLTAATYATELSEAALTKASFNLNKSQFDSIAGLDAATAAMLRQKAVIAEVIAYEERLAAVTEWQATGFAKSAGTIKTTMVDIEAVAGGTFVSGMANAGRAVVGFAGMVATAVAPLLALYAGMEAVEGIAKGFDAASRNQTAVGDALDTKRQGPRAWYDVRNDPRDSLTKAGAWLQGKSSETTNSAGDSYIQSLVKAGGPAGSPAATVRSEYATFLRALNKHDEHAAQIAEDNIKAAAAQQYEKSHNNVAGYSDVSTLTKEIKDALQSTLGKPLDPAEYNKPAAAKHGRGPTEQSEFQESVANDKRQDMAGFNYLNNLIKAGRDEVNASADKTKTYGGNDAYTKEMEVGFDMQIGATKALIAATEAEVTHINARISQGQALMNSHKKGSAAYESEAKTVHEATAAREKANGAIVAYEHSLDALSAQKDKELTTSYRASQLGDFNRDNFGAGVIGKVSNYADFAWDHHVQSDATPLISNSADYLKSQERYTGITSPLGNSEGAANAQANILDAGLKLEALWKKTKDPAVWQFMQEYNKAFIDAGKAIEDDTKKMEDLDVQVQNIGGSALIQNSKDLDTILGTNSGKVDYLVQTADAYKKIHDQLQELDKLEQSYGPVRTQQQQSELTYARQQLAEQEALIPVLEKVNEVRASAAYKSIDGTLDSLGTKSLDADIDKLLHVKKDTGGGAVRSILGDLVKTQANGALTKSFGGLTDTLFGISDPNGAEKKLLADNVQSLSNIEKDNKADIDSKLSPMYATFHSDVAVQKTFYDQYHQDVLAVTKGGSGSPGAAGSALTGSGAAAQTTADATSSINNELTSSPSGTSTPLSSVADSSSRAADSLGNVEQAVLSGKNPVSAINPNGSSKTDAGSVLSGAPALSTFLSKIGGDDVLKGSDAAHSTTVSGVLGDATEGAALAGLTGGNSLFASLGAAGLGAAGTAIGGPIGGQIGTVVGGLLGGLFGPHETAADQPDINDTQQWGQFVSNLGGGPGTFNGQVIDAQSQYSLAAGNESLSQQLSNFLNNPANETNLTSTQQGEFNALKGMEGSNGLGLNIASENQGNVTLGSGAKDSVTAYEQLVGEVQQAMQGQTGPLAPIMSINAYGAGPGYQVNPYNIPGYNASEFAATNANQGKNIPAAANYYGTPGVGQAVNPAGTVSALPYLQNAGQAIMITSNLTVDGTVLASVVNSVNASNNNRQLTI